MSGDEPTDPAGTRPKVDRDALLPARIPPSDDPNPGPADGNPPTTPAAPSLALEPLSDSPAGLGEPRERREAPHAARFQFILGALLAIGVVAILGLIYAVGVGGDGRDDVASWSPWRPSDDGVDGAQQIADHVGPQYRMPNDKQLVLVTGGEAEIADLPIKVAMRETDGDVSLVEGDTVLYRLCGLGERCSIAEGRKSKARMLLLRREALELALYSFRYLRGIDHVVVFLPPPPGEEQNAALFFKRGDVASSLDAPLRATLQAPPPSIRNVRRAPDTELVDRLTTRGLFRFSLTQGNQDANVFLVLQPPELAPPPESGGTQTAPSTSSPDIGEPN